MKGNASNIQVKQLNRNRVFRYINSREKTSMPEIAMALHISTPTVLSIVNELEKRQMVEVNGEVWNLPGEESPRSLLAVKEPADSAVGLGYYGKPCEHYIHRSFRSCIESQKDLQTPFVYSDDYFAELARLTEEFVERMGCASGENRGNGNFHAGYH